MSFAENKLNEMDSLYCFTTFLDKIFAKIYQTNEVQNFALNDIEFAQKVEQ